MRIVRSIKRNNNTVANSFARPEIRYYFPTGVTALAISRSSDRGVKPLAQEIKFCSDFIYGSTSAAMIQSEFFVSCFSRTHNKVTFQGCVPDIRRFQITHSGCNVSISRSIARRIYFIVRRCSGAVAKNPRAHANARAPRPATFYPVLFRDTFSPVN